LPWTSNFSASFSTALSAMLEIESVFGGVTLVLMAGMAK
jgi:hypothetical protein